MKEVFKISKWMIVLFVMLVSCDSGDEDVRVESIQPRLTDAELFFSRNAGDMRGLFNSAGLDLQNDKIQYNVDMYKVEYTTMYGDEEVTASGLVFLPLEKENPAVVSFQHGTIASEAEAPTNLGIQDLQLLLYAGLAGTGVVTVVPDFIGFGASGDIMHPYYVEQPSADAVLDNIRAAAELAEQNEISVSNRLYLAGYSQGGYVTMAAHKSIEENGFEFFELQASFPASGGYDIPGVRDFFFEQEVYQQPFFLAYVAESYRTYYEEDEDFLSLLFQDPYATQIPTFFNGSLSGSEINSFLTDTISDLVNPGYLSNTGSQEFAAVNDKMEENSMVDWIPSIRMQMFHGDADVTVPYRNSVAVYETFIQNGASEDVVTFTSIPGAGHASGVFPYIESMIEEITMMEAR